MVTNNFMYSIMEQFRLKYHVWGYFTQDSSRKVPVNRIQQTFKIFSLMSEFGDHNGIIIRDTTLLTSSNTYHFQSATHSITTLSVRWFSLLSNQIRVTVIIYSKYTTVSYRNRGIKIISFCHSETNV